MEIKITSFNYFVLTNQITLSNKLQCSVCCRFLVFLCKIYLSHVRTKRSLISTSFFSFLWVKSGRIDQMVCSRCYALYSFFLYRASSVRERSCESARKARTYQKSVVGVNKQQKVYVCVCLFKASRIFSQVLFESSRDGDRLFVPYGFFFLSFPNKSIKVNFSRYV